VPRSPTTDLSAISHVSDDTNLVGGGTRIGLGTVLIKIDKKRDQGLVEGAKAL
jgi:hypothetical protein